MSTDEPIYVGRWETRRRIAELLALAAVHSPKVLAVETRRRRPSRGSAQNLTPEQQAIVDSFRARRIANKTKRKDTP